MPNYLVAKGISVTFSGLSANLIDIEGPGYERPAIDVTHQGSGVARDYAPAPFINGKPITLTVAYNRTLDGYALAQGDVGTLTITMPVPPGGTFGATHVVQAFVTDVGPTGSLGEKMTAQITFQPTGEAQFSAGG